MDGVAATQQIRKLAAPKNAIPIFAMTAHAMQGAREEYLRAGMDDYVSKPFQPAELFAKLKTVAAGIATQDRLQPQKEEDASGPLDIEAIEQLAAVLPEQSIADLISIYLTMLHENQTQIDAFLTAGDFAAIARIAHGLVSASGNLGAMQTSDIARELEQSCPRGDLVEITSLVSKLKQSSQASAKALTVWQQGLKRQSRALEQA
jgi:CheY-like chemotaxis protein